MSEKNVISKMDNMFKVEKNRGRKVSHCVSLHDDTWDSIKKNAKLYGVSVSVYLEKLQELYSQHIQEK